MVKSYHPIKFIKLGAEQFILKWHRKQETHWGLEERGLQVLLFSSIHVAVRTGKQLVSMLSLCFFY